MFKRAALALRLALAGLAPAVAADGGRYGEIEVVAPKTAPRGLVILFSDAGGLKPRDRARLDAIADAGAIAVGVERRRLSRATSPRPSPAASSCSATPSI